MYVHHHSKLFIVCLCSLCPPMHQWVEVALTMFSLLMSYNVSNPISNVSRYLTMSHNASLGGGASIALSSQEPPLQPLYPVHQGIWAWYLLFVIFHFYFFCFCIVFAITESCPTASSNFKLSIEAQNILAIWCNIFSCWSLYQIIRRRKKTEKIFEKAMFATSSVWQLGQTKDERRKRKNQQIGTEMPRMYNVKQIQHDREKN